MTSDRKLVFGFALSACLVAAVAFAAFLSVDRLREDDLQIAHVQQVIGSLNYLLATATEAESLGRAYAITGDESYVRRSEAPLQALDSSAQEVIRLIANTLGPVPSSGQLLALTTKRTGLIRSLIDLRRRAGFDAAQAFEAAGEGRRVHDAILQVVDELKAAVKATLKQRLAESEANARFTTATIGLGSLLSTGLAGLALFLVRRDFAGSRRAHATLQTSNARLASTAAYVRGLLEASMDPIFTIAADGAIMDVNAATEGITGVLRDQLIGTQFSSYFSDPEAATRAIRQTFAEGPLSSFPLAIRDASGSFTELLFKATTYRNTQGDVAGVFAGGREFAARTRAEKALRLTQFALDRATDGVVWSRQDASVHFVNDTACRSLEYTREELLALTMPQFDTHYHAGDWQAHWSALKEAGALTFETTYRTRSGRVFPAEVNANYIEYEGESYHCAIVRDISERKRVELTLRIAAIAFESQEGMLVTDGRGLILQVNRAFTEMTGYTAEAALGQTPRILKSGRHDAAFYVAMWESLRESGSWQGEIWNRRKSGQVYPEWLTITAVKDGTGSVTHYVGTLTDITQRKAAEDEIRHLAYYDPLTQLPNRRLLLDRLHHALATAARSHRHGALLFIDLDNFKILNDTRGHDQGDLFLQLVAGNLASCVRESDTVARFGGDEFLVMLPDLSTNRHAASTQAKAVSEKIRALFDLPFQIAADEYVGTASIGVTLFSDRRENAEELLKQADLAMYQAKAAGRNAVRLFDPGMQVALEARTVLEAELRVALKEEQFLLYYQPQVDEAGRTTGVEALSRWQHPRLGLLLPTQFIPVAEETGLIVPLGQWVLNTACRQLATWANRPETAGLTVAVNVSAREFSHPEFVDQVLSALDETGADPGKLKLEITESLLLEDTADASVKMEALKSRGVCFSLDDFGSGYSSLSSLKQLPLDELKIDLSFVKDVCTDPNDAAIVRTVLSLGQTLGLGVIAEGVETAAQRDFLAANGCRAFQGYLFGQAVPTTALRIGTNDDA